jgi:hypothetical protein
VYLILLAAPDPGVYSASKKNEYQRQKIEILEVERDQCMRLTTSLPSVIRFSRQHGILNISESYRPPWPVTGIIFLFVSRKQEIAGPAKYCQQFTRLHGVMTHVTVIFIGTTMVT